LEGVLAGAVAVDGWVATGAVLVSTGAPLWVFVCCPPVAEFEPQAASATLATTVTANALRATQSG
jgi:hypothetical protein